MERSGMKFNNYPLRNELKEGLLQYERDTNISPHSLVESLIEKFLIKEEYLIVGAGDEDVPFPTELNHPPIKNVQDRGNGKFQIYRRIDGIQYRYGTGKYDEVKILVEFLKSKNWDLKYSTIRTKLKGRKQIDFLFSEMEKESELVGTE